MVSFIDHYNDSPQKLKLEKIPEKIQENNYLLCKPKFSSATKIFFIKNTKNKHTSASNWWEYTKYLSKNSTTQKNITISRKNLLSLLKTQQTTSSASVWWGSTKSGFKGNARTLTKKY